MTYKRNLVSDCKLLDLNKIKNKTGNITIIENSQNFPFNVQRIYYLYDVPGGEERGGHAHYDLEQIIVAASGSFDVVLDDGENKLEVSLNRPNIGLHIVPGLWREINNFSSGSICLVLASLKYSEEDYIRNYDKYLEYIHAIR